MSHEQFIEYSKRRLQRITDSNNEQIRLDRQKQEILKSQEKEMKELIKKLDISIDSKWHSNESEPQQIQLQTSHSNSYSPVQLQVIDNKLDLSLISTDNQ